MFDSLIKRKVDFVVNDQDGKKLREIYKIGKRQKKQISKEEKKDLKLYLQDKLDTKALMMLGQISTSVKCLRSTNPQRNSIDDLIELNNMFHPEGEAYGRLYNKILREIILFIKHWDIEEHNTKENYKVRKTWGGVK